MNRVGKTHVQLNMVLSKPMQPRTFGIPLLYMPNNNLTTDLKRVYNVVGNFELCRLAQKGKKAKRQKGKKVRTQNGKKAKRRKDKKAKR